MRQMKVHSFAINNANKCMFQLSKNLILNNLLINYFQIGFFVGGYLFPLILIIILYTIMLNRLWKQGPGGHASAESIRNKKRVVKMVLTVIVIFALWWLPIQIILVLRYVN